MKKILLILIPIGLIFFFIFNAGGSADEYVDSIEKYQSERHEFFRTSEGSPFIQNDTKYQEVEFFEPNPDFKVNGKLDRLTKRELLTLGNSDGSSTKYLKFGYAKFRLEGKEHSLLVLKALGFGNQFLTAFGDETSGESTYGGGRYLDLEIGKSNQVVLDFNKAYNPYCAYFADYLCPLPPRENFLEVAIKAGEKDYNH